MTKLIAALIAMLLFFAVGYAFLTFVFWDYNPFSWGWFTRFLYVVYCIVCFFRVLEHVYDE